MDGFRLSIAAGFIALSGCADSAIMTGQPEPIAHMPVQTAEFSWFEYSGADAIFHNAPTSDSYQNPVLNGFYPDPSVTRVEDDFYMVNSTFGYFPGLPVFHSQDLVSWTQIGNVIDRPDMIDLDGVSLTGGGLFAPAIEHHDGTFYVINTCVRCGNNFMVTAKDPAGPWSDPNWLDYLPGIDPSLFFDDDGRVYIVHHGNPEHNTEPSHTGIYVVEIDPETFAPVSEDVLVVDGGLKQPWDTDWIEGPHLYKVDGEYILSAAGGGTGYYHQQLAYKSASPLGPYTPNPDNPILTQFGLPDSRPDPVTATGHADLIEDKNGKWWAVFLGTRPYDFEAHNVDPGHFHTGRETFLLPVNWRDGWPVILEKGGVLPYKVKRPDLPAASTQERPVTGNFTIRDTFQTAALAPQWLFARTPDRKWWGLMNGSLVLEPRAERLGDIENPSFVGQRVHHMNAQITTEVIFAPKSEEEEAGLAAVQNDEHYFTFGIGQAPESQTVVRVRERRGPDAPVRGVVVAEREIDLQEGSPVQLRITLGKSSIDFEYSLDGAVFETLLENADSTLLTSAVAGGFTGAIVGPYAEGKLQ